MTKPRDNPHGLWVEFLYSGKPAHGAGFRVPAHTHPFWQLEIITSGRITAMAEHLKFDLRRGAFLLITPGCKHGFHYQADTSSVMSCKLRIHSFSPSWPARAIIGNRNLTIMYAALNRALPDSGEPCSHEQCFIEDLLLATIRQFASGRVLADKGRVVAPLQEKVDALIAAQQGRALPVREVAAALGFSTGYISAQFRKATGQGIKNYLDHKRADFAARLLRYADLTIGQVAQRMGFSDQFVFSRFFRRTRGLSPREYRCKATKLH